MFPRTAAVREMSRPMEVFCGIKTAMIGDTIKGTTDS
jgi:hypothetical protein